MIFPAPLPFFVYGTLRRGFDNYTWFLADETINEVPAVLDSAQMYEGPGYPNVVYPSPGHQVVGTLMYIAHHRREHVQASLDRLGGFTGVGLKNHLEGVTVEVTGALGDVVPAHTYVIPAERAHTIAEVNRIPAGDWALHDGGANAQANSPRKLGARIG